MVASLIIDLPRVGVNCGSAVLDTTQLSAGAGRDSQRRSAHFRSTAVRTFATELSAHFRNWFEDAKLRETQLPCRAELQESTIVLAGS